MHRVKKYRICFYSTAIVQSLVQLIFLKKFFYNGYSLIEHKFDEIVYYKN